MTRRDGLLAGLLAVASSALYLSFPTKFYVFEGLARAMPIEAGRFGDVFLGNYLAYGFVGWCFHHLLGLFGPPPLAVISLQVMDCLIGALGVALFYLTLRLLDADRRAACAWSAVLAVACGYWMWSTDAQNYIFSTFLLGVNLHFLVRDISGRRVRPAALGALQALAVMGHIVNGILGVVYLWRLRRAYGKRWGRPLAEYLCVAAAGVVGAYALVLGLFVHPQTAREAFLWLVGSLKKGDGTLRWHGGLDAGSIRLWLRMSVNIVASFAPPFDRASGGAAAQALLAAARGLALVFAARAAWSLRRLEGARRETALLCLVWLGSYALVFTSWEPQTMVYRVSDLVPLTALLFLGAEASAPARWRAGAAALALCLGLGNFLGEIYPRSLADNNELLTRMSFVKASTPDGSWIASPESQGGGEELYLPFFAERRPIILSVYRARPDALSARLAAILGAGQPVFITSEVASDDFWRGYFAPYRPRQAARRDDGFALLRLAPPASFKRL